MGCLGFQETMIFFLREVGKNLQAMENVEGKMHLNQNFKNLRGFRCYLTQIAGLAENDGTWFSSEFPATQRLGDFLQTASF